MPPKKGKPATASTTPGADVNATAATSRPRRTAAATAAASSGKDEPAGPKRSRQSKPTAPEEDDSAEPPKKRGRKAKSDAKSTVAIVEAVDPEEKPNSPDVPAPRKRGRPPKGGETTKVTGDDAAAADQLEEELVDAAEDAKDPTDKPKGRKSKAPAKKAVAKGDGKVKASAEPQGESQVDEYVSAGVDGSDHYWLMKAEQEDREVTLKSGNILNTKFTIDDLKAKGGPEPWDGVRNMVARNNMRNMTRGELAFFYASGGKGKNKPGISGIMEIVKEHEPDWTVYDEDAYGFVEPEKRGPADKPQWSLVHVEYRKKLKQPVTLKRLQEFSHPGGVLEGMQVLTNTRVSVSKVTKKQWDFIVNNLIDGYEHDG